MWTTPKIFPSLKPVDGIRGSLITWISLFSCSYLDLCSKFDLKKKIGLRSFKKKILFATVAKMSKLCHESEMLRKKKLLLKFRIDLVSKICVGNVKCDLLWCEKNVFPHFRIIISFSHLNVSDYQKKNKKINNSHTCRILFFVPWLQKLSFKNWFFCLLVLSLTDISICLNWNI